MIQKQGQDDFVLSFRQKGWQGLEQEGVKKKRRRGEKAINILH